jgi:outer membrane immunogenic protein
VHQDIDWFGTARLRVGFLPTCRLLLYGTGGLAYGDVNFSADTNYVNSAFPASASETKVGWTAGAGAEFALTRRWSVKVEYLYFDLGDESSTANRVPLIPPFQVRYDWETTAHTVNVGLNFRF